jgi:hypothetical protein
MADKRRSPFALAVGENARGRPSIAASYTWSGIIGLGGLGRDRSLA